MIVDVSVVKVVPFPQVAEQVCEREYSSLVNGAPFGHFWSVLTTTGSPPDGAVQLQPLAPQGGVQPGPIQGWGGFRGSYGGGVGGVVGLGATVTHSASKM